MLHDVVAARKLTKEKKATNRHKDQAGHSLFQLLRG